VESVITDSANSAHTYTTGHKSANGALGVYPSRAADNLAHPKVETLTELVKRRRARMGVGVVTNTEIEDATPASMVAHTRRRGDYDVIVRQMLDAGPDVSGRCLAALGLCFCLAPVHHPAMARVGPLRRSLGRPTVFNLVGPLCNPAGADVQVIGVGRPAAREPLAEAAVLLGARRVLVVSGHVGDDDSQAFDEVSLFGPTDVIDVSPGSTSRYRWTPDDFGLAAQPATAIEELAVADPAESAAAIRGVLAGERGPRRDVVVLNAAAVLWAAGRASDPRAARALAERAIDSAAAATLLERLAGLSHESVG
jgi:anthranilate phosphoribosyltransferase